jgi:site-specific DNA-methyltransferase (adenine-specific)
VLKPGGHAVVWALPRTSHWTATALEDAGFEIRDVITHHFGSGFPKSLDVSKAIDRAAGATREVVGARTFADGTRGRITAGDFNGTPSRSVERTHITAPATEAARAWDGWGTALKPASEHWILCRKPLAPAHTVAANVLEYGTGALNIDACRVALSDYDHTEYIPHRVGYKDPENYINPAGKGVATNFSSGEHKTLGMMTAGRWPANLLLSHSLYCDEASGCALGCPVAELDAQSGIRQAGARPAKRNTSHFGHGHGTDNGERIEYDTGGASRFFPTFRYAAKASRAERNRGCEGLTLQGVHRYGAGLGQGQHPEAPSFERNTHPTVKPQSLMTWLITLITPPGGVVLDPFAGSGSTCVAAHAGGWRYIGIEREAEYVAIARARLGMPTQPAPIRQATAKRVPAKKRLNAPSLWEVSA